MARRLDPGKNYIVTFRDDPDNPGKQIKTITAECTASDPEATNEFDKGPNPIRVQGDYNGSETLDEMVATCDAALRKQAGI